MDNKKSSLTNLQNITQNRAENLGQVLCRQQENENTYLFKTFQCFPDNAFEVTGQFFDKTEKENYFLVTFRLIVVSHQVLFKR